MDAVDRSRANNMHTLTSQRNAENEVIILVMFLCNGLYTTLTIMYILAYYNIMIILQVLEHFGHLIAIGSSPNQYACI